MQVSVMRCSNLTAAIIILLLLLIAATAAAALGGVDLTCTRWATLALWTKNNRSFVPKGSLSSPSCILHEVESDMCLMMIPPLPIRVPEAVFGMMSLIWCNPLAARLGWGLGFPKASKPLLKPGFFSGAYTGVWMSITIVTGRWVALYHISKVV